MSWELLASGMQASRFATGPTVGQRYAPGGESAHQGSSTPAAIPARAPAFGAVVHLNGDEAAVAHVRDSPWAKGQREGSACVGGGILFCARMQRSSPNHAPNYAPILLLPEASVCE